MRHLWQWFHGYLLVCLHGRQINRFLNVCSKNGISLWKITYDLERKVRVHIRLKDFYVLKPYLKKTKTHLKILRKKGFPFWCYNHPRLKWMLVVFAICVLLMIYSRTYIWNIQIYGNEKIATAELKRYLEANDVLVGKRGSEIDCNKVEYLLRQEFQELGWVSVHRDKTTLCIDIKESLYGQFDNYPLEDDKGYHLIANKDAHIESIVTLSGTPVVIAGEDVKKGDILVRGECEIFDDIGEIKEVLHVQAQAVVCADVSYPFFSQLNEMEILSIKMAGIDIDTALNGVANLKLHQFLRKLEENGVIILDKNVMIDKKAKNIVFLGLVEAREQIGINIPVEETRKNESE